MFRILLLSVLLSTGCSKSCSRKTETEEPPVKNLKAQITNFPAISVDGLTAQQLAQFVKLTNDEICPCNCPMSFAQCLQQADTCKPAVLLGQWIVNRLKEDVPMEMMARALSQEINSGFSASPRIIDLDGYSTQGKTSAPITLVEFADFECVHCKQTAEFIEQFLGKHPEVRFVYKHFPMPSHEKAKQAAIAAEAAAEQGKFWDMHHALFRSIRPLTDNQIDTIAKKWKLGMTRFQADLKNPKVIERVENSMREGDLLGIQGTPALFFNGRPYYLSTDLLGLELRLAMEKARAEPSCH